MESLSLLRFIRVAEEVADLHGDFDRFQRDYQELRSRMGIRESIQAALEKQNLLEVFLARG